MSHTLNFTQSHNGYHYSLVDANGDEVASGDVCAKDVSIAYDIVMEAVDEVFGEINLGKVD